MICEKSHAYMSSLTIGMLSSLLQTVLTKFHKIREYVMCCVSFLPCLYIQLHYMIKSHANRLQLHGYSFLISIACINFYQITLIIELCYDA